MLLFLGDQLLIIRPCAPYITSSKSMSRPTGETGSRPVGMKIGIKRFGSSVQISLQCDGDYQAIELYDRMVKSAENGQVKIDLQANQSVDKS